jgi:hypothetical protein
VTGDGEPDASGAGLIDVLTRLNIALADSIGPGRTGQVREYIEHHEFGLALELIIALLIRHGLRGRAYEADIAALAAAMGMEDSPYLAEWREHLGNAPPPPTA